MRRWATAILLGVALALSACGYRFAANGKLPPGQSAVAIPMFVNRTAEANVEAYLTAAFRENYARRGLLGGDSSPSRLEGTVTAVTISPILAAPGRDPTFRIHIRVHLQGAKASGEVVQAWVDESEEFPSGGDVVLTGANRETALRRLVETVARSDSALLLVR